MLISKHNEVAKECWQSWLTSLLDIFIKIFLISNIPDIAKVEILSWHWSDPFSVSRWSWAPWTIRRVKMEKINKMTTKICRRQWRHSEWALSSHKDKMLVLKWPEERREKICSDPPASPAASYPWEDRALHLVTSETMSWWKWGKCKFWISCNLTSPILSPNESPHTQSEMFPTGWEWIPSKKDYSPDWFRTNFSSTVCTTYNSVVAGLWLQMVDKEWN